MRSGGSLSHGQRLALFLAASLLVQCFVGAARAQQVFRLYSWHGHLGASGSFENQDISGAQSLTEQRFFTSEEVALRTNGELVSPKLAAFTAGGRVSFIQDQLETSAPSESTTQTGNGLLFGYDGHLSLVQALPYSIDFFASRNESNVRRTFVGRTLGEFERRGATLHARGLPLPSIVTFQEEDSKQRQRLGTELLQQDETRRTITYRGGRRWQSSSVDADYRFDDVEDRVRPVGNFQLHLGGISHIWRPSFEFDRALFSNARVFARQGETKTTTVTENESLTWQLTPTLWASSNYGFSLFDSSGTQVTTHRGSAGLRHQWYRSLSSSLHGESTLVDFGDGEERDYGGGANWSYVKEIAWGGTLGASLAATYLLTDRDVPPGLINIIDEQHGFSDAAPVILGNLDVVPSSIVLTDESRTVIFSEGLDYFVDQLGRRTSLRRNPFGNIEEGEPVLVSYGFEVGGPFRIGSRPLSYSTSADFGWVRLFYTGERLRQDVFEGEADVTLGDIDEDSAGVEFRRRGERLELAAVNEYRRYRSSDISFQSFTFTQTAMWTHSRQLRLQLLASEAFHDFSVPDRSRDFFTGRALVDWRLARGFTARGFAGFRYQKETSIPRETVIEAGGDLRWTIGQFTVALLYEFDRHELGGTSRMGNFVRLETIRSF